MDRTHRLSIAELNYRETIFDSTGDASASSSHSGGATPFKVQVNFDIPIFDGRIDANAVDRWLNLLEGYF